MSHEGFWLPWEETQVFEDWLKSRKVNTASPMGRAVTTASVIGLHMVVAVFIGFGIGYFLDKFFDTSPWLTIIFLFLGIIAGFKNMFAQGKMLMAYHEKMEEERRAEELAASMEKLKREPEEAGKSENSENGSRM